MTRARPAPGRAGAEPGHLQPLARNVARRARDASRRRRGRCGPGSGSRLLGVRGRGLRPGVASALGGRPSPPRVRVGSSSGRRVRRRLASRSASSSCCSSSPGASNGLRRRRCGSASRAATRMSSASTVVAAAPGRVRDRGARGDDVGAHAVDVERRAHRGDLVAARVVGEFDRRQQLAGAARSTSASSRSSSAKRPANACGVGVEGQPAAHHLGAHRGVARRGHLDGQPEPVEQLRAQLALLGVHRADEQEPRRVPHRHPVALDVAACPVRPRRAAGRRGGRAAGSPRRRRARRGAAPASRPGSNDLTPSVSARSRSSEPVSRSSVEPTGSSTSRRGADGRPSRRRHAGRPGTAGRASAGSQENRQPGDDCRRAAAPRPARGRPWTWRCPSRRAPARRRSTARSR